MPRPSSPLRLLRLLALVVHLLLPGLVGVADADHSLSEAGGLAHVESQTHDCDDVAHGDDCVLLHFLRSVAIIEDLPVLELPAAGAAGVERTPGLAPARLQHSLPLPRGPPHLS